MSVIFRDPPIRQGVPGVWEPVLRELMARPGDWGLIRETDDVEKAYRHTANLRHARLVRVPAGYWEFTARSSETGGEVYGRYLGRTPEELTAHMNRKPVTNLTTIPEDPNRPITIAQYETQHNGYRPPPQAERDADRFEVYQVYADGNPERVAAFPTAHEALQRRAQLEAARLTYPPAYFVRDSLDDERTVEEDV